MEHPPMWIWAIIIGIIIGTKLVIRWQATKQLSRPSNDGHKRNDSTESSIKKNSEDYKNKKKSMNIRSYKYGPFRLYKRRSIPRKD